MRGQPANRPDPITRSRGAAQGELSPEPQEPKTIRRPSQRTSGVGLVAPPLFAGSLDMRAPLAAAWAGRVWSASSADLIDPLTPGERSDLACPRPHRRARVERKASEWMPSSGRRVASSHGFLRNCQTGGRVSRHACAICSLSRPRRRSAPRIGERLYAGMITSGAGQCQVWLPHITCRLLVAL